MTVKGQFPCHNWVRKSAFLILEAWFWGSTNLMPGLDCDSNGMGQRFHRDTAGLVLSNLLRDPLWVATFDPQPNEEHPPTNQHGTCQGVPLRRCSKPGPPENRRKKKHNAHTHTHTKTKNKKTNRNRQVPRFRWREGTHLVVTPSGALRALTAGHKAAPAASACPGGALEGWAGPAAFRLGVLLGGFWAC